jgi:hypothetical protein
VADDAGALLVRSGLVSSKALDDARANVEQVGGTIGEQLVASGVIGDDALTDFYKSRLLVPQVNPNTLARLPAKIVAVIPSELAIELRAIPVSLDADNNLTVAMSDPSDRHAVDEIAWFSGTYVVRAVATQMQIAWCLAHYYGHVTDLGQRLLEPTGVTPPRTVQAAVKSPRTRGITGEINAQRKHALVPLRAESPPPEVDASPGAPKPRPRTASGEIRAVSRRAPSIKPPMPEEEDSGPMITVEPAEPMITVETSGPVTTVETSGPVITVEAGEPSGPIEASGEKITDRDIRVPTFDGKITDRDFAVPRRTRPAEPDPPELAARAGELSAKTNGDRPIATDEPRIVIADDLTRAPRELGLGDVSGELRVREHRDEPPAAAAVSVQLYDETSSPVLMRRARDFARPEAVVLEAPTAPVAQPRFDVEDDDEVVELAARKPTVRRDRDRDTQLGIGAVPAATRARPDAPVTEEIDDLPAGSRPYVDMDPTTPDNPAAPRVDYSSEELTVPRDENTKKSAVPPTAFPRDEESSPGAVPPLPSLRPPGPSGQISLDTVKPAPPRFDDEDGASDTITTLPPPGAATQEDFDPADSVWGPPGTTIPPPLLGAFPGPITPPSGIIPIASVEDSAPLIVAPPVPPEVARSAPANDAGLLAALEQATAGMLELIRHLDRAGERDDVVKAMMEHLALSHRRAGFFAARKDELQLITITPRPQMIPYATLRLDRPSTLADVVGTRLPYRGPMHDEASRAFLQASLGACPSEILLVPITVRERVVGVLFGEHRSRHTFDDQLALAARAAGNALERILKARRG